ncbi:MAG: hypothetical protein VYE22_27645 [Myxococcota bacterium]|nr:hypothetical protein [Myxococcota bacterium]
MRRYIVSPVYDWALFLLPPVLALGLGVAISGTDFALREIVVADEPTTGAGFVIGVVIHAHLVAVFFRSHGNPTILRRFPLRFLLVPPLVWTAIVVSPWLAILATVVATFWDVWHSGAQTFGFGRIYDRNAGFPVHEARRLDFWLNQLLYAGPILAGVTLMEHLIVLEDFETFEDALSNFLVVVPVDVHLRQRWLTWSVVLGGTVFIAAYVLHYVRLWRRGLRPSWLKVWLYASTGLCSLYTWGFNSWGEAFFIMNLFHAVQYLALIWASEHGGWKRRLRLEGRRGATALLFVGFAAAVIGYGLFVETLSTGWVGLWALTLVVSLMHFWYDAFIWSVRAKQV